MKVTFTKTGFEIDYTKEELENLKDDDIKQNFQAVCNHLDHKAKILAEIQMKQIDSNSSIHMKQIDSNESIHLKELETHSHYTDSVIEHDLECRKMYANLDFIDFQPDDNQN